MRDDLDFDKLVDEHYGSLARFALSLTGQGTEAADLVQETFLIWARKGHQLADARRVKNWLFTSLYRQFLGHQRRRTRFRHHDLKEVASELPVIPPATPLATDWEQVSAGLEALDVAFRAPVSLFYLEDYSYAEIADILDVPLGTVKSRISRGIAALQTYLLSPAKPRQASEVQPP